MEYIFIATTTIITSLNTLVRKPKKMIKRTKREIIEEEFDYSIREMEKTHWKFENHEKMTEEQLKTYKSFDRKLWNLMIKFQIFEEEVADGEKD